MTVIHNISFVFKNFESSNVPRYAMTWWQSSNVVQLCSSNSSMTDSTEYFKHQAWHVCKQTFHYSQNMPLIFNAKTANANILDNQKALNQDSTDHSINVLSDWPSISGWLFLINTQTNTQTTTLHATSVVIGHILCTAYMQCSLKSKNAECSQQLWATILSIIVWNWMSV